MLMPFNIPLVVTALLLFGSIGFAFLSLFKSNKVRGILKSHKYLIIVLLIANVFFKYPASNHFFNGREYEDAYVYNATGRYLAEQKNNSNYHSFLTASCVWGNLTNCQMSVTYSGHVIGFPFILYLLNILFGFNPLTANIVSLFLSCISIITLFVMAFYIIDDIKYSVICCLLFTLIPIYNVFSSTTFSEPTSMAFVSLSLLIYLDFMTDLIDNKLRRYSLHLVALLFLMGFIILIKRENLIVALCLPLTSLIYNWADKKNIIYNDTMRKILLFIPITIICIWLAWAYIDFFNTIHCEEADIGASAFSISYFYVNIAKYIKGLLLWNWYFVFSYLLFGGILLLWKYKISIVPIIIYFGYLILYTSHHRSYYFIKGGGVSEIDFVHYMINTILIYSLIGGIGFYHLMNYIIKLITIKKRFAIYGLISLLTIGLCGLSYYYTYSLRKTYYEDEYMTRILPTKKTLDYISHSNAVIITSEPLLFQIYGPKSLYIIDLTSISMSNGALKIDKMIDSRKVYFLDNDIHHNYYDMHRWPYQMEYLNNKKKEIIYTEKANFTLYKLTN